MVSNPALTGFTAPKILWLRNHEPRLYERLAKVLLPKDEIRRRLTGEFATDLSDASGTLLLDVTKRRWSKRLLSKLELDSDLLPSCHESDEITGTLSKAAAKTLGLTTSCRVVAGAGLLTPDPSRLATQRSPAYVNATCVALTAGWLSSLVF